MKQNPLKSPRYRHQWPEKQTLAFEKEEDKSRKFLSQTTILELFISVKLWVYARNVISVAHRIDE